MDKTTNRYKKLEKEIKKYSLLKILIIEGLWSWKKSLENVVVCRLSIKVNLIIKKMGMYKNVLLKKKTFLWGQPV